MSTGAASGKRGRAAPEMNVTPLVDVVLVLLIIFMVITPLLAKQFWLALPDKKEQHEPAPPDTKDSIVVTVAKDGQIHINRDAMGDAEFPVRLRRALAGSGARTIFFDAHDDAPFARASQALDMARGAGATTIAVSPDSIVKN
jgi:biopolymer transport protein ExbD